MYGRQRYTGGGFGPGLTPMVKRLLIANGVVYLIQLFWWPLTAYGAISVAGVFRGYLWQPFTYMWLHDPTHAMHILFNMFALWMFGGQLEMVWGSRRFLRFYLICGVGAGFIILFWNAFTLDAYVPTLGASGAIYGLLAAFSLMWPDRTIMLLFPPIPIKAIWFIPVLFLLQIMMGGGENISHIGHLGGVIVAAILLRAELARFINWRSLSYRWHRYKMRNRLRAVQREDWERRRRQQDEDDDRPTFH